MDGRHKRKLEIKFSVITEICRAKHILFAETSEHLTKRHKMQKWQQIFEHSVAIGGVSATRSWSYLRDVYWPNVKRSTMTKVNRQGILSRIDYTVLDILNIKDSVLKHGAKLQSEISILEQTLQNNQPTLKHSFDESKSNDENLMPIKQESISLPGSPVPSSHHDDTNKNDYLFHLNDDHSLLNNLDATAMENDIPSHCSTPDDGFRKINLAPKTKQLSSPPPSTSTLTTSIEDDMSMLRKRKLEEQVEYLKLQNIKARLEIKEAEIRVLMLEKDLELKNAQMSNIIK